MRHLALAALVTLLPLRPAAGASLLGEASAGGGYDSNLSLGGGDTPVVGGWFAIGRGSLGLAWELDADDELSDELSAELLLDGSAYPRFRDLDLVRPSLVLGWQHRFSSDLALRLEPTAALRFLGDSSRSGWEAGGRALARLRVNGWLAVRAVAGFVYRETHDASFSSRLGRVRGAADFAAWRGATLRASYALEVGQDTFYAPVTAAVAQAASAGAGAGSGSGSGRGANAPGGRRGTAVSTFGTELVAYQAWLTGHGPGLEVTQHLGAGFALTVGYSFLAVGGEEQGYQSHTVFAELGWSR